MEWIDQAEDESERNERTLQFVARVMRQMGPAGLEQLRRGIGRELDAGCPLVTAALELVEGAQALRAMGAKEGWR